MMSSTLIFSGLRGNHGHNDNHSDDSNNVDSDVDAYNNHVIEESHVAARTGTIHTAIFVVICSLM
jgi:hypothetical protein